MATNKVTTNVIDMSGNTGGLVWAKGTSKLKDQRELLETYV